MKKTDLDFAAMEYEAYGLTEAEMRDMDYLIKRGTKAVPLDNGHDEELVV
jgi:hypothetical protein